MSRVYFCENFCKIGVWKPMLSFSESSIMFFVSSRLTGGLQNYTKNYRFLCFIECSWVKTFHRFRCFFFFWKLMILSISTWHPPRYDIIFERIFQWWWWWFKANLVPRHPWFLWCTVLLLLYTLHLYGYSQSMILTMSADHSAILTCTIPTLLSRLTF